MMFLMSSPGDVMSPALGGGGDEIVTSSCVAKEVNSLRVLSLSSSCAVTPLLSLLELEELSLSSSLLNGSCDSPGISPLLSDPYCRHVTLHQVKITNLWFKLQAVS